MTWVVPAELEDAVYARGARSRRRCTARDPRVDKAIVDRSKRYTSERERLAAPADRPADLAARAAFFTIADAMKIAIPLGELAAAVRCPHAARCASSISAPAAVR